MLDAKRDGLRNNIYFNFLSKKNEIICILKLISMPNQKTRTRRKLHIKAMMQIFFKDIEPNFIDSKMKVNQCKDSIVDTIFNILTIYEEASAYYDGRYDSDLDGCIKYFKNNLPNEAKLLLKNALSQKFYLPNDGYCPYYRPSLLLLNEEWMKSQGYKFIAKEKTEKSTFRKIYGSFTEEAKKINLHHEV